MHYYISATLNAKNIDSRDILTNYIESSLNTTEFACCRTKIDFECEFNDYTFFNIVLSIILPHIESGNIKVDTESDSFELVATNNKWEYNQIA